MPPKNQLVVSKVEQISELSLDELCSACGVDPIFIEELVSYGTIEPKGMPRDLLFDASHLRVIRMAIRLHHDLEINHPGVALAIDLMNEIEELRKQVEVLEKYLLT